MANSIAYHSRDPQLHYIRTLGPKNTVTVGLTHYTDRKVHPRAWTQDIVVNQHPNALCFVLLVTSGPKDIWPATWWNDVSVTISMELTDSSEADAIMHETEEGTPDAETKEAESSAPKPSAD
ncbi:hypothetical protein DSL72_002688 [Monilinia vaccinii-corymbosi]|uniref:Uncharacterized protein n=1 Tax=Monilinia vaccinii-corymbosi TaxID=61207 RepID=A0A8A3PDF0_9HELO|nr:hypothetical protein DSL72_002688 [Monilinia vaccinii-corymbosi]